MKNKREYLTKEKHQELAKEFEWLQTVRRRELSVALKEAISLGDLSENAEYHQAREDQVGVEQRIKELEAILKDVVIVEEKQFDRVNVGATVTLQNQEDKKKTEYLIVGTQEADMLKNRISVASPLVKATLGKKKGDLVSFESPQGTKNYKIIDIR